ncbi:MAG: hypothetical protein ACO1NS_05045 [Daejeonella sp.]|uniref:hypothetical protein n=1 Tax=Daejeonella sp. JGW-45 TaxID=3034148 RepID=UPI0023EACFD3|nr:hypothetical protein [Daejeonella sp. JGW-45]
MRYIALIAFLLISNKFLVAQTDTTAYNVQRNKINKLLDERSERFGQYDNSLTKRSGIFGLKTKRDMQASNDILTQIVLNDNQIFTELKILLDYKDFEKKEVETRAETVEGRIDRFQSTITSLQQQNEVLKGEVEKLEKREARLKSSIIILVILSIGLLIFSRPIGLFLSAIKKLLWIDRQNGKE